MGATDLSYIFKHYDWQLGVRDLQTSATYEKGYKGVIRET